MTPSTPTARRAPMLLALLAAALVVAVAVVWVTQRDGGSDDDPSTRPSTAAEQSVLPTPSVDASGSPLPSREPGQTEPGVAPPASDRPKPVRVPIEEPAELGGGVAVDIVRIEAVEGEARGPGETSGPALRFTVRVVNDSDEPLSLRAAVLTAYYGAEDTPAGDLSGPGVRMLKGELAPGGTAQGRYVFAVPTDERDRVRVDFSVGAERPRAVFVGSAP